MANVFDKILKEGFTNNLIPAQTKKAIQWYREKAQETIIRDQRNVIRSNPVLLNRILPMPGYLYLFHYKPKYYESLPYHDRFPIVFPFRRTKTGFYGINLHYLPLEYRAILMDRLYSLSTDKNYDEETRLRISYQILSSTGRFRFFRPCIRQYLNNHTKTRYALIPANQWDIALFLPLERFIKPNGGVKQSQLVHLESVRKIRRGR
jgi:hypothetical protein